MNALPAIWLTAGGDKPKKARRSSGTKTGLLFGLGAGLGVALQLHFLGQVPNHAVFYGIALCMISGAVCCLPFYQHTPSTKALSTLRNNSRRYQRSRANAVCTFAGRTAWHRDCVHVLTDTGRIWSAGAQAKHQRHICRGNSAITSGTDVDFGGEWWQKVLTDDMYSNIQHRQ